jgi:hypothetical protein
MGIMNRIFGKARQAKPAAAKGNELVDLACNLLATQIDLGSVSVGDTTRKRLEEPYARGYMLDSSTPCCKREALQTRRTRWR